MKPLVSIVIENQTAELSTEPHVMRNLREALRQIESLPAPGGEVILVSSKASQDLPEGIRYIVEPGKEYYALKNAGFREALGNIVIFTDSDCRLGDNYVARVLELFNRDVPKLS